MHFTQFHARQIILWGWMRGLIFEREYSAKYKKGLDTCYCLVDFVTHCAQELLTSEEKVVWLTHCRQKHADNLVSWNSQLNHLFAVVFTCQLSWEKHSGVHDDLGEQLEDFWKATLPKDYGEICVWRRNESVYLLHEWLSDDIFISYLYIQMKEVEVDTWSVAQYLLSNKLKNYSSPTLKRNFKCMDSALLTKMFCLFLQSTSRQ